MRYPTLQQRPFEAQALACSRCGSALPVDPLAANVFCPFCQAVTAVPAGLRAGAGAYGRAVQQVPAESLGVATLHRLVSSAYAIAGASA